MPESGETYEFVLTDMTIFSSRTGTEFDLEMVLGPADSGRSKELMDQIDKLAMESKGKRTEETTRENKNTIGLQERDKKYFPQEVDQFITVVTYAFASAGALAVFVRNVLGAAKDWRDLSKGRRLEAREKGKGIEIDEDRDQKKSQKPKSKKQVGVGAARASKVRKAKKARKKTSGK